MSNIEPGMFQRPGSFSCGDGNRGRDGDRLIDEVSDATGGARNFGMPCRIGAPERPESVFPQERVMAFAVPWKDEAARRDAMASGQGQAGLQIGPDGLDRQRGVVEERVREGVTADLLFRAGGSKSVHDVVPVPERVGVAIGAGVRGEPFAVEPALAGMDELRVRPAGCITPAFAEIEVAEYRPGRRHLVLLEEAKRRGDRSPDIRELPLELGRGEAVEAAPDQLGVEGHGERPSCQRRRPRVRRHRLRPLQVGRPGSTVGGGNRAFSGCLWPSTA